jgi:dTDP-3-amino-3,4,6-trideoxy-alpha-D-glucose transaminase
VTAWGGSTAPAANGTTPSAVPFTRLDRDDPELLAELLEVVARVAGEAAFTLGHEVEEFERQFAAFCETPHAVGVSSGTAALELALRGLGIGPGDEVIVPTNSFVATAEAVSATGAMPRLVDVDEATALLTVETVEPALTRYTRCLIPVHLYGRTVDMDPLLALARRRGFLVVEDACQAHGARYRGRPVGSLGDAGCFSFYPSKNLGAWGDGGAVVSRSSRLAERIRLLRSHGEAPRHNHRIRAGTDRLDGLQAAILRLKLDRLAGANRRRRDAGDQLRRALSGSETIPPSAAAEGGDHVFHLFVVRSRARDRLREYLGANGIASGIHYPKPIHLQPAYASLGLNPGSLPIAERLAHESCSLPIFPGIEESETKRVAAAVAGFRPRPYRGSRRAGSATGSSG